MEQVEATQTSIKVKWTQAVGATAISLERSMNGSTWYSQQVDPQASEAVINNLSANTTYKLKLIVSNGANAGTSNLISVKTTSNPITELSVVPGTTSVKLVWPKAPANATKVEAGRSEDNGQTWRWTSITKTSTSYTFTGLTPNKTYLLTIRITGGANDGTADPVEVTTEGLHVDSFAYTTRTDTTASFKWNRVSDATSLIIQYWDETQGTWVDANTGTISKTATTAKATDLIGDTSYKFRLYVEGGKYGGESNYVTLKTLQQQVTTLSAPTKGPRNIDFSWKAVADATSIALKRSTNNGGTWTTVATVDGSATTATVDGLSPGTTYLFKLEVTMGDRKGTSNELSVTTSGAPINDFTIVPGTTSIKLVWGKIATNAKTVQAGKSEDGGKTWRWSTITKTATSYTFTGLTPNKTYLFALKVTGGAFEGTSDPIEVTTDGLHVESLAYTARTDTTASFKWNRVADATSLKIQYWDAAQGAWIDANTGTISKTATTAKATGLTGDTTYKFRLYVEGGRYAGESNYVTLKTLQQQVTTLSAPTKGPKSIGFSWKAVADATSIAVKRSTNNGGTWTTVATVDGSATSATVDGLSPGTTYLFKLEVTMGDRKGTSNELSVTTSGAPINDFTIVPGTTSIKLVWGKIATNAKTVQAGKSEDGGKTWRWSTITKTATSYTFTGLTPNKTYLFALKVTGGAFEGTSDPIEVTTDGLHVESLAYTARTDTTASFKWNRVADATSLKIQYWDAAQGAWIDANTGTISKTATTAKATGLTGDTSYKFRLYVEGGRYAGESNYVTLKTLQQQVTTLSAPTKGPKSIGFSWKAVADATSIAVKRSTNNGGTWTTVATVDGSATSATVNGLSPGTTYLFKLEVTMGDRKGTSNELSVTTSGAPINDFTFVRGINSVKLVWGKIPTNAKTVQVGKSEDNGKTWRWTSTAKTSTNYLFTGLTPNKSYLFTLKVTGGPNDGTSDPVEVTTYADRVEKLSSSNITSKSVTLRWKSLKGAEFVTLLQYDGGDWVAAATGPISNTATSATVTGLSPEKSYRFKLVVIGGANEGESDEIQIYTKSK
ncbi:fibronectin type III domain-containing protein [Cohnella xylanilytica]|uniref:Fibronectin type III domain-containing protein n=1 Tax=Cohnella xylanilytica TaxID=557555 RepID=A0A841U265_9BACL|nr:fibronectin type III domain-containing protein [Cohnella xylanilytica]